MQTTKIKLNKIIGSFILLLILTSAFLPFQMVKAVGNDIICPTTTPTEILIYFHGLLTDRDYAESLSTFKSELNQIKSQKPGIIGVHPLGSSGAWGTVNINSLVNEAITNCGAPATIPVALAGHSAGGKPIINNAGFSASKIILLDAIYQPTSYQKTQCSKIRVIDGSTTQTYTPALVTQCKNEKGFVYTENKTSAISHFDTRAKLSDYYLDSSLPSTPPTTPTTLTTPSTPTVNTKTTYTLLAPLPGLGLDGSDGTIDTDPAKNPCPFGYYLNIMIKLFLGICGVLAVVMIVMGGVQYMTSELVSSKEEGKKSITNAIFGLILALGAYLILNTINPDLLNICLNNLPKETIIIVKDDSVPQAPINGKYCTNTTGTNGGYSTGADWATIAGEKATLPAGFVANAGECAKVGDKNCTSLRGLNLSTLNTIKTKCTTCGTVTVSGGTECWLHGGPKQSTTHHPGSATIDLRLNSEPKLDAYIKSGTNTKGGWYKKDGINYLLESDHWHVGN